MRNLPRITEAGLFFSRGYGVAKSGFHPQVLIYAVFAGIWGRGRGSILRLDPGRARALGTGKPVGLSSGSGDFTMAASHGFVVDNLIVLR
jgi:hypothetical protein